MKIHCDDYNIKSVIIIIQMILHLYIHILVMLLDENSLTAECQPGSLLLPVGPAGW